MSEKEMLKISVEEFSRLHGFSTVSSMKNCSKALL